MDTKQVSYAFIHQSTLTPPFPCRWSLSFAELVASVSLHLAAEGDDVGVWLDIFAINQVCSMSSEQSGDTT
jgi:hypothetical protein